MTFLIVLVTIALLTPIDQLEAADILQKVAVKRCLRQSVDLKARLKEEIRLYTAEVLDGEQSDALSAEIISKIAKSKTFQETVISTVDDDYLLFRVRIKIEKDHVTLVITDDSANRKILDLAVNPVECLKENNHE